jgi:hypothetical protein
MSAWLKAGLVGVVILIVLNLIGQIPFVGCITAPLSLAAYIVVGLLAASYLPPKREAGYAAGQGALAAIIAALGGGIASLGIGVIRAALGGVYQGAQIFAQLPPEIRYQLRDLGVNPELFAGRTGIGSAMICGSVCCLGGIVFAAVLGAIGAAIYASVNPD